MGALTSTADRIIARIAAAAHAIVARAELKAAGVTDKQIEHRVRIGILVPVYRGVFSVGHPPLTVEARYTAAVKACGDGAVLCDAAAAFLLRILRVPSPPRPVVSTRHQRRIPGLKTRRLTLDPRDISEVDGIACVTVPRAIVDLAQDL